MWHSNISSHKCDDGIMESITGHIYHTMLTWHSSGGYSLHVENSLVSQMKFGFA